jgi:hypothetical protein
MSPTSLRSLEETEALGDPPVGLREALPLVDPVFDARSRGEAATEV